MKRQFPYVPKSNKGLLPGDYWAVPLSDGSYAAGRVIEIAQGGPGGMRMFLGGLMDWHGPAAPESRDLEGRRVLHRGKMHVLAITQTGGSVLGNRPLELDGIAAEQAVSGGLLMHGLTYQRPANAQEMASLPTLGTWGFNFIRVRAERAFGTGNGV